MGGLSLWHWIIVLLVVLILFGRGRISEIMGDFGKGIKSFKEGIHDESGDRHTSAPVAPPVQIAPQPVGSVEPIVPPAVAPAAPVAVPVPTPSATPTPIPTPSGTDPKTGV
jgi:sec-independent protein translocase protein TatA